jgi:hypothetical protein
MAAATLPRSESKDMTEDEVVAMKKPYRALFMRDWRNRSWVRTKIVLDYRAFSNAFEHIELFFNALQHIKDQTVCLIISTM